MTLSAALRVAASKHGSCCRVPWNVASSSSSSGTFGGGWSAAAVAGAAVLWSSSSSSSSSSSCRDDVGGSPRPLLLSTTKTHMEQAVKKPVLSSESLRRRMTSIGQFSILSETVDNPSIVTFVMTLQTPKNDPWTVERFCELWDTAQMPQRHERFHLVAHAEEGHYAATAAAAAAATDDSGVEFHVSETLAPVNSRSEVLQRIQSLQTSLPWELTEKLWHIYIVPWMKAGTAGTTTQVPKETTTTSLKKDNHDNDEQGEALLFFQGHHALADGASMGAALMDLGDEAQELRATILREMEQRGLVGGPWWKRWMQSILFGLWIVTGSLQSAWYHLQLWMSHWFAADENPWQVLEREYQQRRHRPNRTVAQRTVSFTAACSVDQAKWVARTLAGKRATVNDLFCDIVSRTLARQLAWHRKRLESLRDNSNSNNNNNALVLLPRLRYCHMAIPVHLKGGMILPGESVGNSIGAFCVSLPCEKTSSSREKRLKQVHRELSYVKKLPTAFLSNYVAQWSTRILPRSWISFAFSRAHAGSSCVVTNVRGPDRPIHLQGSQIKSIHSFVPLPPGIPIGVVVGSYNNKIMLALTAQPWAVPDGDLFVSWMLEEYLQMVEEAKRKEARKLKKK